MRSKAQAFKSSERKASKDRMGSEGALNTIEEGQKHPTTIKNLLTPEYVDSHLSAASDSNKTAKGTGEALQNLARLLLAIAIPVTMSNLFSNLPGSSRLRR